MAAARSGSAAAQAARRTATAGAAHGRARRQRSGASATQNRNGGGAKRQRNGGGAKQARQYAAEQRKKMDARRKKASGGASGWIAERAGDWELDAQDYAFMERQKYFWNPLIDYWFRMEMEGWERLPEPPALLIGIHSGAPFVWDAWTVGIQW